MNEQIVLDIGRQSLLTVIKVAAPMLGLGMGAGIMISLIQAATQVQDQTLSFVPKIFAVIIALFIFGPWMIRVILNYARELIIHIPGYVG